MLRFDFHAHLDLLSDPASEIANCERNRIVTLTMTTLPRAWQQNKLWSERSAYVHPGAGLHPELVGEHSHEAGLLFELVEESRIIGEIGIDASPRYAENIEKQSEIFQEVVKRASARGDRIASIHSRRATNRVVNILEDAGIQGRLVPILHWYSGSLADATRAVALGAYFSVNRRMLASQAGRRLIQALPIDRLLTETDRPFVPQEDFDQLSTLVGDIANARSEDKNELEYQVIKNAEKVLAFVGIELPST